MSGEARQVPEYNEPIDQVLEQVSLIWATERDTAMDSIQRGRPEKDLTDADWSEMNYIMGQTYGKWDESLTILREIYRDPSVSVRFEKMKDQLAEAQILIRRVTNSQTGQRATQVVTPVFFRDLKVFTRESMAGRFDWNSVVSHVVSTVVSTYNTSVWLEARRATKK